MINESVIITMKLVNQVSKSIAPIKQGLTSFNKVLGQTNEDFKQMAVSNVAFGDAGTRIGTKFRAATSGLRGFRMEMLGVMFFGMAMANMFSTLLKPAADSFGIFSVFGEMLKVLFIPIMAVLAPILFSIMSAFMNLPEPVKLFIGVVAVVLLIVGKLIMILGMLTLGIGAISLVFGSAFLPVIAIIAGIIVAVWAAIMVFKNWGDKLTWLSNIWEGIKTMFSGSIQWMKGIFKVMIGLFTGNWDLVKEGYGDMWEGIGKIFWGFIDVVKAVMNAIWDVFWGVIGKMYDKVKGLGDVFSWIGGKLGLTSSVDEVQSKNNTQINQVINIETSESTNDVEGVINRMNQRAAIKARRNN